MTKSLQAVSPLCIERMKNGMQFDSKHVWFILLEEIQEVLFKNVACVHVLFAFIHPEMACWRARSDFNRLLMFGNKLAFPSRLLRSLD